MFGSVQRRLSKQMTRAVSQVRRRAPPPERPGAEARGGQWIHWSYAGHSRRGTRSVPESAATAAHRPLQPGTINKARCNADGLGVVCYNDSTGHGLANLTLAVSVLQQLAGYGGLTWPCRSEG